MLLFSPFVGVGFSLFFLQPKESLNLYFFGKLKPNQMKQTWSSGWFPREEGALGWRVWQGRFSRTELARMGFLLNVCLVLWACEGPWGLLLGFLLMFSEL